MFTYYLPEKNCFFFFLSVDLVQNILQYKELVSFKLKGRHTINMYHVVKSKMLLAPCS